MGKNICIITPTLDAGGIENYIFRFLNAAPSEDSYTVICQKEQRGDLTDLYGSLNINIIYQSLGYLNYFKAKKYYQIFFTNRFDVVCDFNGNFAGIVMLLAKIAGIKKRFTFYRRSSNAYKPSSFKNIYNRIVNLLVYIFATNILSNSAYAIEYFFPYKATADTRFKLIYNGVNVAQYNRSASDTEHLRKKYNIPLEAFVIGHVGRFDVAKNHETLFKAAKIVKQKHHQAIFVFCGKGTDESHFELKLQEHEISEVVISLGLQKNVPEILQLFDLFVFPSITEGQPNALIEAMVAGIPVIASNIQPIKEIVPDPYVPHLIQPENVEMYATKIDKCITDVDYRNKLKLKKFASANFDSEKRFKEFYEVLTS